MLHPNFARRTFQQQPCLIEVGLLFLGSFWAFLGLKQRKNVEIFAYVKYLL